MSGPITNSPETIDDQLSVLTNELHRTIVLYFCRHSTETATTDDIADYIRDQQDTELSNLEVRLHHVILPRLAKAGVLEYDSRSNTVRYRRQPTLETWVQSIVNHGEIPE